MPKLKTLKELASIHGYEIRSFNVPLSPSEDIDRVVRPFDFSQSFGGTLDVFNYYNDFYLYPKQGGNH